MNCYLFCLLWNIVVFTGVLYVGMHESWLSLLLLCLLQFPGSDDE